MVCIGPVLPSVGDPSSLAAVTVGINRFIRLYAFEWGARVH
jgi:hypothetical protein